MIPVFPPPSQVEFQSIAGLPPIQVRPNTGQPALKSNSISQK